MDDSMKRTALRLNVSCSLRNKKFLVLGEKEDTVTEFLTAIKKMFNKLYPHEANLEISGLKNHEGFDIFSDYKLGDLFEDNACLSITESPISGKEIDKLNDSTPSSGFHDEQPSKSDEADDKELLKDTAEDTSDVTSSNKTKTSEEVNKKNVEEEEKDPAGLLSSGSAETKRFLSESADEQDKKKKRHKNAARKKKTSK